jgi:hypothetical protein
MSAPLPDIRPYLDLENRVFTSRPPNKLCFQGDDALVPEKFVAFLPTPILLILLLFCSLLAFIAVVAVA